MILAKMITFVFNGLVSPNAGICSSAVNLFNGGLPNFLLRNTELSIQFVTRLNL